MTNENHEMPGQGELRECPYCQADESHIDCVKRYNKERNTYFYYIDCNLCEMSGPTKDTPEEAVKAWNGFPRHVAGWIPYDGRELPKHIGRPYLVTLRTRGASVKWIYLTTVKFHMSLGFVIDEGDEIMAWMNLPEPYIPPSAKEGDEG